MHRPILQRARCNVAQYASISIRRVCFGAHRERFCRASNRRLNFMVHFPSYRREQAVLKQYIHIRGSQDVDRMIWTSCSMIFFRWRARLEFLFGSMPPDLLFPQRRKMQITPFGLLWRACKESCTCFHGCVVKTSTSLHAHFRISTQADVRHAGAIDFFFLLRPGFCRSWMQTFARAVRRRGRPY